MKKNTRINIILFTLVMIISILLPSSKLSIIISFLSLIILFFINSRNSKKGINKKILITIMLFFIISLILALYDTSYFHNIYSTTFVFLSIILIFLNLSLQDEKKIIFSYVFKYLFFFTLFLILYGAIIYFLGSKSLLYDANLKTYYQALSIFNVNFKQSAVGDIKNGLYVGSLTGNPNTLSFLCIFSLIYLITLFNSTHFKKISYFILILVGLFISGSRLGFLLLFIITLLDIIIKIIDFSKKKNLYFILFLLILFIFIAFFNYNHLFNNVDLNGRAERWSVGFNNIHFLGHGINSDNVYLIKKFNVNTSMHNSYISLYVNYGYILASLFLVFIFSKLKEMLQCSSLSSNNKFIFLMFFSLLCISLTESVFLFYGLYNYLFFYILLFYVLEVKEK